MPEITIISANLNSPEFAQILVEAVRTFTKVSHEILIVDNGSTFLNRHWLREQPDVQLFEVRENRGQGWAVDYAVEHANARYVCFLDIDCFPLRKGWDKDLIACYKKNSNCKLVTHTGDEESPLHPSLLFFERDFFRQHQISVADKNNLAASLYRQIVRIGGSVRWLYTGPKAYRGRQDTFYLADKPTFFHFGYGTRFCEHAPPRVEKIGDYTIAEYFEDKGHLWKQPVVQKLLGITPHMAERAYRYKGYLICRSLMLLNKGLPWIEPGAIRQIEDILDKRSNVLEIGSGSSTAWFAGRARRVVSLEHLECWHAVVSDELAVQKISNVDLRLERDYPEHGLSVTGQYSVILIDGPTKGRELAIRDTIKHVRPGGLFVIDDAQRELYDDGIKMLEETGWKRTDYPAERGQRVTSVWEAR